MSAREQRRYLLSQIAELVGLRDRVALHPLMGPQTELRIAELNEQVSKIAAVGSEPRTILFFSGQPVSGSEGIDAEFVADILNPFTEMVKSQYAVSKFGRVGNRGPRKDEGEARLLLTGTPRGSFGLELSPPMTDDLFAEERLSTVLVTLTRLIESAGESDEGFLMNLDDVSTRAFSKVPEFFKVLRDRGANLRIQTGDIEVELTNAELATAYERVNTAVTTEKIITPHGVFRGATLDTWRFDFRPDDGETISGRIGGDLVEESVTEMLAEANKPAVAAMNEVTTVTAGGALRRRYELLGLTVDGSAKSIGKA